jgi:hypothetical protein
MAVPNVPFNQLPKEAQRRIRRENPDEFPLRDTRPARDVDVYRDESSTSAPQPKSRWESIRGSIQSGGERGFVKAKEIGRKGLDRVQEYNRNQLKNAPPDAHKSPKKEPNRANWKEAKEPRGRVSSRDIYKDGVLQERIHYGGPAKPAKQPKPRRGRREDPLGGIGSGMRMSDFLPSNSGFGLGGMMGAPAPSQPRKKKGKRQPRQERNDFDFIDHMNSMPDSWKGLF